MKINPRVSRKHRTPQAKIERLARRIFRLGFENMRAQTVPCGFCGPQGEKWWKESCARRMQTDREARVLTRRITNLIGVQR